MTLSIDLVKTRLRVVNWKIHVNIRVFSEDRMDYKIRRIGFDCTCGCWRTDDMGEVHTLKTKVDTPSLEFDGTRIHTNRWAEIAAKKGAPV